MINQLIIKQSNGALLIQMRLDWEGSKAQWMIWIIALEIPYFKSRNINPSKSLSLIYMNAVTDSLLTAHYQLW